MILRLWTLRIMDLKDYGHELLKSMRMNDLKSILDEVSGVD